MATSLHQLLVRFDQARILIDYLRGRGMRVTPVKEDGGFRVSLLSPYMPGDEIRSQVGNLRSEMLCLLLDESSEAEWKEFDEHVGDL